MEYKPIILVLGVGFKSIDKIDCEALKKAIASVPGLSKEEQDTILHISIGEKLKSESTYKGNGMELAVQVSFEKNDKE